MVAQVLAPHGIRGELKCRVVTDFPKQRFKRGNSVQIDGAPYQVHAARIQGRVALLKLEGIDDRDAAGAFRNKDVEVSSEQTINLPRGQFYWHQVIGLDVENATTHEILGKVTDILETGANDVYIVRSGTPGREILVPAIKDVIKKIDPTEGKMLIEPLPGMIPP